MPVIVPIIIHCIHYSTKAILAYEAQQAAQAIK